MICCVSEQHLLLGAEAEPPRQRQGPTSKATTGSSNNTATKQSSAVPPAGAFHRRCAAQRHERVFSLWNPSLGVSPRHNSRRSQGSGAALAAARLATTKRPLSPSRPCSTQERAAKFPSPHTLQALTLDSTPTWSRVGVGSAVVIGEGDFRAILLPAWRTEMASAMM